MKSLDRDKKIDVEDVLRNLENYRPRRKNWIWRTPAPNQKIHEFEYKDMAESLDNSVPLPSAKYFDNIDPQGTATITTESLLVVLKMIFVV